MLLFWNWGFYMSGQLKIRWGFMSEQLHKVDKLIVILSKLFRDPSIKTL